MSDPKDYRTESGHAPGEVTPDGIGVLHVRMTRAKVPNGPPNPVHPSRAHVKEGDDETVVPASKEVK
jgi:hypothetical protein